MAIVLKPFAFAANGYTVVDLEIGDDRDFGQATAGLSEAGFISVESSAASDVTASPASTAEQVIVEPAAPAKKPIQKRGR